MATNNIQLIQKWCEETRKLLKTTKKGLLLTTSSEESEALKKHIRNIAVMLQRISSDPSMASVYGPLTERYRALAAEMQRQADAVSDKRGADEAKKKKAQTELNTAFEQLAQDIQDVQPLLEARSSYMLEYDKTLAAVKLLGVTPFAEIKTIQGKLDQIHDQAQQGNVDGYRIGQQSLKNLMGDVKKETEAAAQRKKDTLKQREKKPEAMKKIGDARLLLAEMSDLVGVAPTVKQYNDVIEAALKLGESEKWLDAVTKLNELKSLPKLEQVKKDSGKQDQILQGVADYKTGTALLEQARKLMPEDVLKPLEKAFKQGGDVVLEAGLPPKGNTLKPLGDAVQALKAEVTERQQAQLKLDTLSTELTNLIGSLRDNANPLDIVEDELGFNGYTALCVNKMLPQAVTKGQLLKVSMGGKVSRVIESQQSWTALKKRWPKVLNGLNELKTSSCNAVKIRALQMAGNVSASEIERLEAAKDWAKLVDTVLKAEQTWQELRKLDKGHGNLGPQIVEADQQYEERRKALMPAVQQYDEAVAKRCAQANLPLMDAGKHFVALVSGVTETWNLSKDGCSDRKALRTALDAALSGLDDIEESLRQANTPEGIAKAVGDHDQELTRPAFQQAWGEFEALQLQCQALDNTLAQALARRGQEVTQMVPGDWKGGLIALKELITKAKSDVGVAGNAKGGLQQTILKLGQEVLDDLKQAEQNNENADEFEGTFKALMDERAELLLLGKGTNVDALLEAEQGLKDLKLRVAKLSARSDGRGTSLDKVYTVYGLVENALKAAQPHLHANDPAGLLRLTQAWTQLKEELFTLDPEPAFKKLNAFMGRLEVAKSGADKVVTTRNNYEEMLPAVKQMLADLTERNTCPAYAKQLAARLKAATKKGEAPETVYEALAALTTLSEELINASRSLDTAIAKEKVVLDQQLQDDITLKTYTRSLKLCEDKYREEAAAAVKANDGDKALIKELGRMLDTAKQTKKDGDVAKALEQVNLTIERAKQIVANPYGPAIGSRNNLPKDNQTWREAITEFKGSLDEVRNKTLTMLSGQTVSEDVTRTMDKLLLNLKTRFDPLAFDAVISDLMDKTADSKALRAARERAIAQVHANRALLTQHPQVLMLLKNPAAKGDFSKAYRRMQSALTRLEANISRSVR